MHKNRACSMSIPWNRTTSTSYLIQVTLTVDLGTDGSYDYTGLTYKMHDFDDFFLSFLDRPTKTWVPTRRLAAKRGAWPFYYECGYEEVTQRKTWVPTRRLAAKRGAWPPNETVTGVISGSHEYTGLT